VGLGAAQQVSTPRHSQAVGHLSKDEKKFRSTQFKNTVSIGFEKASVAL